MSNKLIKRLSNKKKVSIEKTRILWEQAINTAIANNHANDYTYITGVFKKLMGEKLTFTEFLTLAEEGEPTNSSDSVMPDHKATDGKPKKKKNLISRKNNDEDDIDASSKNDDDVATVN